MKNVYIALAKVRYEFHTDRKEGTLVEITPDQ